MESTPVTHAHFEIDAERSLVEVSDAPHAPAVEPGHPRWLDVVSSSSTALRALLRTFGVHQLAIEACLDALPHSRVSAYGNSLFLGMPLRGRWDGEGTEFLSIVCVPGLLITVRHGSVPPLAEIQEQFTAGRRFHKRSTSALLYEILDHVIDADLGFALEARHRVDALEEQVDEAADSADPRTAAETVSLKRATARLGTMLNDQLHAVVGLQTIESDAFSVRGLQDFFRDAAAHLEHATRSVERQRDRLAAVHQEHLLWLQDRVNRRLQSLTVLSAIFLPLTLIAGIYGMNFKTMPELHWRYGYPGTLAAMLVIAGTLLLVFKRWKWFE